MGQVAALWFRYSCFGVAAALVALWAVGVIPLWPAIVVGLLPFIVGGLLFLGLGLWFLAYAAWIKLRG